MSPERHSTTVKTPERIPPEAREAKRRRELMQELDAAIRDNPRAHRIALARGIDALDRPSATLYVAIDETIPEPDRDRIPFAHGALARHLFLQNKHFGLSYLNGHQPGVSFEEAVRADAGGTLQPPIFVFFHAIDRKKS